MGKTVAFLKAVAALLEAVEDDEALSGGLLSRSTLRRTGELRRLFEAECACLPGVVQPRPEPPRRDDGRAPL